jgi:hypothetical protein
MAEREKLPQALHFYFIVPFKGKKTGEKPVTLLK